MLSRRDKEVAERYNILPDFRGNSLGEKLITFTEAMKPLVDDYIKQVGQKTKLHPNIEVDQFMSFIYEKYKKDVPLHSKEVVAADAKGEGSSDVTDDSKSNSESRFFWLNANPRVWNPNELQNPPATIDYTTHNEKGNPRKRYSSFKVAKKGDRTILYEASPTKKVRAILEVSNPIHYNDEGDEVITFRLVRFFQREPSFVEVAATNEFADFRTRGKIQGSFFQIDKGKFNAVLALADNLAPSSNERPFEEIWEPNSSYIEPYGKEKLLDEVFIDESYLTRILAILDWKMNIVLQGPPGTGKSFFAKRLAWCVLGGKDEKRLHTIQFHQSYAYEDFIQGYRPREEGGLEPRTGAFFDLVKDASRDIENKYIMIIDEINRGNLSKIFGEAMLLLENDKRGSESVRLAYATKDAAQFTIPNNVFVIGTMNTADRSLAMVDYALRRRFAFISMKPHFGDKFVNKLKIWDYPRPRSNRFA